MFAILLFEILIAFLLLTNLIVSPAEALQPKSRFWDGEWTDAQSGYNVEVQDPENSEGKSGAKKQPQKFFIPPPRQYEDVDPEELSDYVGKDYSPYALVLFPQDFKYQGKLISKGYYQVKLGDRNAGSEAVHIAFSQFPKAQMALPVEGANSDETTDEAGSPESNNAASATSSGKGKLKKKAMAQLTRHSPFYQTMVLKKLGKVVAVLEVSKHEPVFSSRKKQKLPKQAVAQLEMENRQPVLKVFLKHWVYVALLDNP